MIEHQSI